MRWLERLILAAGLATVGYLLWRFNPAEIWAMVSQVGLLGAVCILGFQIFDHALNALGWKLAFNAEDAPRVSLWILIKARIAGDGVNYLTPSGSIAGELIRPGMLGDALPEESRNSSVVVAKFAQAIGQAVFILLGMIFVLQGKLNFLGGRQRAFGLGGALLVITLVGTALWVLTAENAPGFFDRFEGLSGIRLRMRGYLRRHPGRFASSIVFFVLGYAWGAVEAWIICRFMGVPMTPKTALAVEILSNVIDSLMFMVPAKVGTQEAGKTAIFHGLGYQASQGLAFGLIRHTREVAWAAAGFALYAVSRRRSTGAPPPARGPRGPAGSSAPSAR